MDGQDEGSKRIYNQRGLTKKGIAIRKTPEGPSCVVSEEEKKNSSSEDRLSPLLYAIGDLALPLTKFSQRPIS